MPGCFSAEKEDSAPGGFTPGGYTYVFAVFGESDFWFEDACLSHVLELLVGWSVVAAYSRHVVPFLLLAQSLSFV